MRVQFSKNGSYLWKKEKHKHFFDWLGKELGYKEMDDWYNVTKEDIYKHGGVGLLSHHYGDSPSRALQLVYPAHNWIPWRFGYTPRGFWNKQENHRKFFDWLGKQLGYEKMDDWYNVTKEDIHKHGGVGLLNQYYNSSSSKALQAIYPEHNWIPWRFGYTPHGFWETKDNHRRFFDWLGKQLGYREMDDWYNVTLEDIYNHGGQGLLSDYYNSSPSKALQAVYPENYWMLWRFHIAPRGLWSSVQGVKEHERQLLEWLGKQLEICHLDEWYRISLSDIRKIAPLSIIDSHRSLGRMLQSAYPHHQWDISKLLKLGGPPKAAQRTIAKAVKRLFPGEGNAF